MIVQPKRQGKAWQICGLSRGRLEQRRASRTGAAMIVTKVRPELARFVNGQVRSRAGIQLYFFAIPPES